jgi:hypothetical protein
MWIGDVELPDELVQAHRKGELVIFVGAGASMGPPSNLPSFEALARGIASDLQAPFDEDMKERLDLFLGSLMRLPNVDVHARAAARIGQPASAPNALHQAVVALATAARPVRIVTTNYDVHLSTVLTSDDEPTQEYVGPALPVGHDFDGLVYLHGRLGGRPTSLILTDADFGRAYLTDAWASRFLERMFATYTVLFVGYSHNDIVMFYLARGLRPSAKPRYALTDKPEASNWRLLDVKPIRYHVAGGSHQAAVDAVNGWADRARMGLLQHSQVVMQLMAEAPSLIPHDMSYIESVVADPNTVRVFTDHATSKEWLLWVANRPEFQVLFDAHAPSTEVSSTLGTWFTRHYIMVESLSGVASAVLQRGGGRVSPALWYAIGQQLHIRSGSRPGWLTPWVLLLIEQAPLGGRDFLEFALIKSTDAVDRPVAMLIFDHLTRPHVELRRSFMSEDHANLNIVVKGDEYWIHEAWKEVFLPQIAAVASEVITIVEAHLRRAHHLTAALDATGSGFDMLSFRRSAIEKHVQDDIRGPIDILIDAARDCLECLLDTSHDEASAFLTHWADAEAPLLRRLAVHGWTHRNDVGATDKVVWLRDHGGMFDNQLHHEVFRLIEETLAAADVAEADLLVAKALAGPPDDRLSNADPADPIDDSLGDDGPTGPIEDDHPADDDPTSPNDDDADDQGATQRDYRIYAVLHWMVTHAPDLDSARVALAEVSGRYPHFAPSEYPDLRSWMEVGFVQPQPPMTVAELHDRIVVDPSGAITTLREYEGVIVPFRGPSWDDAVAVLADTVRSFPADGFDLLDVGDVPQDLISAVVRGWAHATVDEALAIWIMNRLTTEDLGPIVRDVAELLADGGRDETRPTQWQRVPAAKSLAIAAWHALPDAPLTNVDNWLERAINHPAGHLSQFWVKVVEAEWRDAGDAWAGVSAETRQQFVDMLGDGSTTPQVLAQVILASRLDFFFAADDEWSKDVVLPLLGWDRPERARKTWDGFLTWGRPNDRLLADGLLSYYLETAKHRNEFVGQMPHVLVQHLAAVAVYSNVNPMDDGWLSRFTATVDPGTRAEWMVEVARLLALLTPDGVEGQWQRWMRRYWDDRLEGVPAVLTHEEASAMTRWVVHLSESFRDGVAHAIRHSAGVGNYGDLLDDINDDLIADAPNEIGELLLHLLRGTEPPVYTFRSLTIIAGQLQARGVDTRLIMQEALRLGLSDG